MIKLTNEQITLLRSRMEEASAGGDTPAWQALHSRNSCPVLLKMAAGELLQPDIRGYVAAWNHTGRISSALPLTREDGIAAQGLEPFVQIPTTLVTALIVSGYLDPFRMSINIEPKSLEAVMKLHDRVQPPTAESAL